MDTGQAPPAEPPRCGQPTQMLVQSVDRALTILELLARQGDLGITEIANELGVHKSTASRLVAVLDNHDMVEQTADRGKYRLSFGVIRLAGATTSKMELPRESQPVCARLAADLGETVHVTVLDGFSTVTIAQVRGPTAIASHCQVGWRAPAHATSGGKVLLAFLPPALQRGLVGDVPLRRHTPNTIVSPDKLLAQLAHVRREGYGYAVGEYETGLNAIAAPIHSPDGRVKAAIGASGPAYRLDTTRMRTVSSAVVAGAMEISERIGYVAPATPATPAT